MWWQDDFAFMAKLFCRVKRGSKKALLKGLFC
jgi:hypothetical protein